LGKNRNREIRENREKEREIERGGNQISFKIFIYCFVWRSGLTAYKLLRKAGEVFGCTSPAFKLASLNAMAVAFWKSH